MTQKESTRRVRKGSALENRPLETALRTNNGWMHMMAGQFRKWAADVIQDDRLTCASILECAGHKDAAEMLRGFSFNTNETRERRAA
jgi:hypothetical protein